MFRLFLSFAIFLCINTQAWAQFEYDSTPQLSEFDDGWCAAPVNEDRTCGFQTADAACEFVTTAIYNGQRFAHGGATSSTGTSARCLLAEVSGSNLFIGRPTASRRCKGGASLVGGSCMRSGRRSALDTCSIENDSFNTTAGNPIEVVSGRKREEIVDFQTADGYLKLTRFYMSSANGVNFRDLPLLATRQLGQNWNLSTHPQLVLPGRSNSLLDVIVQMPEGVAFTFRRSSGRYIPLDADQFGSGTLGINVELINNKFEVRRYDGKTYTYSLDTVRPNAGADVSYSSHVRFARLESLKYEGGYEQTYNYNALGEISDLTDNLGRTISFERQTREWIHPDTGQPIIVDGAPRDTYRTPIVAVNLPDGSKIDYEYDSVGPLNNEYNVPNRLIAAKRTASDGTLIFDEKYLYEDGRYPYALTGRIDSAGVRYASWTYDEYARANQSALADGVDHYQITREVPEDELELFTVTNPLGRHTIYSERGLFRTGAIENITGEPSPNCVGDISSINYASSTKTITDREGRVTHMTFDDIGRLLSKTQARGTAEETIETTAWDESFWRKTQTITPGLTTDYERDDRGRTLSMTQTDTLGNSGTRTWTYSYSGPNVTRIDGPLQGSSDTQFFTYDGANLTSVTNELGHVTQITSHNPIGAPTAFIDPNGVTTRLGYDSEHRLVSIVESANVENATTTITYSDVDLVTSITPPNGATLSFTYDDARRLTSIRNAVGETIEYTRNNMGGITETRISEGFGSAQFSIQQVIDERNRVIRAVGAGATGGGLATTQFQYDRESNLTDITDPRGANWQQAFDGLDRLVQEIDPLGAQTSYALSTQSGNRNPLNRVSDARGVTTNYVRNGFGEVIREVSLENGITEYIRDERGLITQMTDARGIVSNYSYDVAGRLLSVTYPSASEDNIVYGYDEGAFGIGQLTSMIENYGKTTYGYNSLGFMTSKTRTINGQSYNTAYTYNGSGDMLSTTYPSGRQVIYTRDAAARIISIQSRAESDAELVSIADGIDYAAFGPLKRASFGDGHTLDLTYDTAYKALTLTRTGPNGVLMDYGFQYDAAGDILAINDNVRPERSQIFSYDPVSRLTSASGAYGDIAYGYNLVGDRLSRDWSFEDSSGGLLETRNEVYDYDPTTARLQSVSVDQTPIREFLYNAAGQIRSDQREGGLYTYTNNARGRLTHVEKDGANIAIYTYDADEQRIVKTLPDGTPIHYLYDGEGRLMSETNGATGEILRDYIWLGLTPIAVISPSEDTSGDCTEDITALETRIANLTTRIERNKARVNELGDLALDKAGRISANASRVEELAALILDIQSRIANNNLRMGELEFLILDTQSRIDANMARIAELDALILDKQSRIAANAARIDALAVIIEDLATRAAALNPQTRADRIAELEARRRDRIASREALITRNAELAELIIGHETRQLELTTRNAELAERISAHGERIETLELRNAELATRVTEHETRSAELTTRNSELAELRENHITRADELTTRNGELTILMNTAQADLAALEESCAASAHDGGMAFLQSDHLGRPVFATNIDGAVIWDAGTPTPFGDAANDNAAFGEAVQTAGAFAQRLMFPGQYQDDETGTDIVLSHNHHRTYDPTLGRYLQSDPIGLAGGLNRYAYVGGNPVLRIDPTGELVPLAIVGGIAGGAAFGAIVDFIIQTQIEKKPIKCINLTSTLVSATLGIIPGTSIIKPFRAFKAAKKREKSIRRILPEFKSPSASDEIDNLLLGGLNSANSFSIGLEIPKVLPTITAGDKCDCKNDE